MAAQSEAENVMMLMEMFDDDDDDDYDTDDDDDEVIMEAINCIIKQDLLVATSLCERKRKKPTRIEDYMERTVHEYSLQGAQVCLANQPPMDENVHPEEMRTTMPQKAIVPLSSAAQSPSALAAQSPFTLAAKSPYPDFCHRSRCKKWKRTEAEAPQWFLECMESLKKEFQEKKSLLEEKNILLKEKNELLRSYIQQRQPSTPNSSE